jgi:hypothetical protein
LSGAHVSAKTADDPLTSTHSVLSDARSSAKVANPVFHADPNDYAPHEGAPAGDPVEATTLGTTTLAIPIEPEENVNLGTAVWTVDGSIFTALKQDGSIVVHGHDVAITLEPGATTTVSGEGFGVAVSGGFLVYGGNTATFESAQATAVHDTVAVTTLLADGQRLVASAKANGDSIVVQQGVSGSFTLAAGEQAVIDGETMSVAQSGGALVLMNAIETVPLSLLATSAMIKPSEGVHPVGSGTGNTASPSTGSGSTGKTADGGDTGSSTSTPEVENLSGGVGRGYSTRSLWLLLFVVACGKLL